MPVAMHHIRALLWSIALLPVAMVSTARGDFCYAWTEYSLEWITDAASAIALGEVTACTEEGRFQFRVDSVLKENSGLDLRVGQTLEGPSLGRSVHAEADHGAGRPLVVSASGLGMPVYSEPSTYPGSGQPVPPNPLPVLRRMKEWSRPDRVVVFFGPQIGQVIQIVNLDRPLGAGVGGQTLYLAADLHGTLVLNPDELIRRVKTRVAEGRRSTPGGNPKVCSHGFYYWPAASPLDGDDYYFIFAPPDPCFKEICANALGPELIDYATRGGELGVRPPPYSHARGWNSPQFQMHMAIWYWFYSGRSHREYAADRQRDFDRVLRYFRGHHQRRPRQMSAVRLNVRNLPRGWQCAFSDSARYFACIDASYVYLYDVGVERPQAARPLYRANTADALSSRLAFSSGSNRFAYSEADGSVTVYDLPARSELWQARFPLDDAGFIECTQLCFSPDAKYLVQAVRQGRQDFRSLRFDRKVIYGWEVETGRRIFAPYDDWRHWLQIVGFSKEDPRLIRITNPERERSWPQDLPDLVWDLETGRTVARPLTAAEWESCPDLPIDRMPN